MAPIYEYVCPHCQDAFEEWIHSNSPAKVKCEKCGNSDAERIISTFGMYSIRGNNSASTSPKTTVTKKNT